MTSMIISHYCIYITSNHQKFIRQSQNATIAEYGTYSYLSNPSGIVHALQSEIYARGPVATGVNAEPIVKYTGGRVDDTKFWHMMVNHIVSIVGWETDSETGNIYWIVRNSWGMLLLFTFLNYSFILSRVLHCHPSF